MVGEHNGGSGALRTGAEVLTDTGGLHQNEGKKYYGETPDSTYTADAGQREIVVAVHGDDADRAGNTAAIEYGLQLASFQSMTIATLGGNSVSEAEIATINRELTAGRWIVAGVFGAGVIGHGIVLQSYAAHENIYAFWDPWDQSEGSFTRADLLNGTIRLKFGDADRRLTWALYCY